MARKTKAPDNPIPALIERAEKVDETDAAVAAFLARWGDRYSHRNLLLLYIQRPDATELHTYRGWLSAGRQVRKGEKAVRLMVPKGTETEAAEDRDERIRVRPISLFDIAQTDPIALPDPGCPCDDEESA